MSRELELAVEAERIQTARVLILGDSGTGKTTLAEKLARMYQERELREYTVVLSKDAAHESALSKLTEASLELTDELADKGLDWRRILEKHRRLYVEVSAMEPYEALDQLAEVLLELGSVLFIIDETNELGGKRAGRRFCSIWTRGRKRWIDAIAIGQSPLQAGDMGIHREIMKRSNALVCFQLRDGREAEAAARWLKVPAERIASLRTPHDGGEAEYVVCHAPTGRAELVSRGGVESLV